jgi:hypothetical protein
VAAAATVLTVVGKGLGWRIGGIAILAAVTIWTYILYFMADRRCEKMQVLGAGTNPSSPISTQLHQCVCETTEYWDYLHDLLAEVANTTIPNVLADPAAFPANSTELGQGLADSEKMMRELLGYILPSKSRYVAYYILAGNAQASAEMHNGWKGRPPDLRREPLRHGLLLDTIKERNWIVLPDVENPSATDRKYVPLCFDKTRFRSFAFLPLRVDGPVNNLGQRHGLSFGALIIESPSANSLSEDFCGTALQTAADIIALAFAGARSNFAEEGTDAKR